MADWVGACAAPLSSLVALAALLRAHVVGAEWLHGNDTIVPALVTGPTTTGRLWVYVPLAALFHYAPDRKAEHSRRHFARWHGILQADAYAWFQRALRQGSGNLARRAREGPGLMLGESSSTSPNLAAPRLPWRRCAGSTCCSPSSEI